VKVSENGDYNCALGIRPVNIVSPKGPIFLFGTLFLKKFYTVFDFKNERIGLALAKQ
jgi:cathepsin D